MAIEITQSDVVRITEACRIFKLDRRTISSLVPVADLGHRSKFVKISDIEAAIAARTVQPPRFLPAERPARRGRKRDLLG